MSEHSKTDTSTDDRAGTAPEGQSLLTQDSLSLFLAAISGGVLGMLLTLLVLALVNGGTLSFSGPRITQLEEYVTRVDENLGSLSDNINAVSGQTAALQQQLGSVETALRNEIATQSEDLSVINDAVETLQITRQQFNHFTEALNAALADMQAMDPSAAPAPVAEPATEEPAAEEESAASAAEETVTGEEMDAEPASDTAESTAVVTSTQVMSSTDLAAGTIAVLLFVDEDGNGTLGDSETNLIGIPVSLLDSEGTVIDTQESSDAGVAFTGLETGVYAVTVDDTLGYELLGESTVDVAIGEEATEGMVVYMPVAAE